jgi:hypothetical protein
MFIFSWTELFPLLWFTYYSWGMKELTEQYRHDCMDIFNYFLELVPCEKLCIIFFSFIITGGGIWIHWYGLVVCNGDTWQPIKKELKSQTVKLCSHFWDSYSSCIIGKWVWQLTVYTTVRCCVRSWTRQFRVNAKENYQNVLCWSMMMLAPIVLPCWITAETVLQQFRTPSKEPWLCCISFSSVWTQRSCHFVTDHGLKDVPCHQIRNIFL